MREEFRRTMGKWVDRDVAWYDQSMTYCACCGLVIPKGYWEAEIRGEALVFCKADCERLYREYRLPEGQRGVPGPS